MPARTRTTTTRSIGTGNPGADADAIDEAADVLRRGGLVAFPTETVYGLGADATSPEAVARIFEAKGRPSNNPLIVHGPDADALRGSVSDWPDAADALADRFWPGPLTIVLPRSRSIPDAVTAGRGTVGVRVPDCPPAIALLRRTGRPVAAPSANRSTGVSPTRAEHVRADLDGRIDLILDGGPTSVGLESTVLDLTADPPRLLRPGAVTVGQLEMVLGRRIAVSAVVGGAGSALSSPGQMAVHYAPRTPVVLLDSDPAAFDWPGVGAYGLIVAGRDVPAGVGRPRARVDWPRPDEAARALYETLRTWDDGGLDAIFVVLPPADDAWRAVRDRLWRASRRWARGVE